MREWLKELRVQNGLTMKEMGKRLCISESYYSSIESGARQKRMDIVLAAGLAAIFQIPVSTVIEKEQKEKEAV